MEAFREVANALPKATLVVTFDAQEPSEHGDASRAFDLVRATRDLPNVRFVGRQNASAIAALYRWADINLFPSQLESFGLPLLEAMAAGTPTIASRLEPLVEVGENTARYHDPRDPHELAQMIIDLTHDEPARIKLGEEASRRAETFTWEKHVDSLVGFLEKAASDPKYRPVR
jgi:glycosyltransferase involved in cell wall biosynthesis